MSTSGSLKIMRVIVFLKLIKRGIFRQIHPRAVKAVVINGRAIPADKVSAITTHILLFFAFFFFSALVLGLNNFDLETTISTSIGLFSNTGINIITEFAPDRCRNPVFVQDFLKLNHCPAFRRVIPGFLYLVERYQIHMTKHAAEP